MTEKPILFSTPMVQAILRNEKSMTRRIIKGEKHHDYVWDAAMVDPNGMMSGGPCLKVPYKHKEDPWEEDGEQPIISLWPKYVVGDLLDAHGITLEVTGVKVERIQDISGEDAKAEGVFSGWSYPDDFVDSEGFMMSENRICDYAKYQFMDLWESIYPGSWDRNDWVAAYTFRRVEK
jgi:hypothetical protein